MNGNLLWAHFSGLAHGRRWVYQRTAAPAPRLAYMAGCFVVARMPPPTGGGTAAATSAPSEATRHGGGRTGRGGAADGNPDKAAARAGKTRAACAYLISGPPAIPMAEVQYLEPLSKLCDELVREGEPDFDGLLRNGINFLQNAGRKVCW